MDSRYFSVVAILKVHPETFTHTEEARESKRSVSGNAAFAEDNFINTTWRHSQRVSQCILTDAKRGKKLLRENLARLYWIHSLCHHSPSVIVHDRHVFGASVNSSCVEGTPSESDSSFTGSTRVRAWPITEVSVESRPVELAPSLLRFSSLW